MTFIGRKHSEETKRKISEAKLGRKHTEEAKMNMSKARIGRKHSKATRKKMSEIGKKRFRDGKWKQPLPTKEGMEKKRLKMIAFAKTPKGKAHYKKLGKSMKNNDYGKANRGSKMAIEAKKKMSIMAKERCKRIGAPKGAFKKNDIRLVGEHNPAKRFEVRQLISKKAKERDSDGFYFKCGKKNPNYIHGRSHEPYCKHWNNKLKNKIRLRDNNKCRGCEVLQKDLKVKLSVHHIDFNKKNCSEDNLITLCIRCHTLILNLYDKYILDPVKFIREISQINIHEHSSKRA